MNKNQLNIMQQCTVEAVMACQDPDLLDLVWKMLASAEGPEAPANVVSLFPENARRLDKAA